jgi:hypothetical protein
VELTDDQYVAQVEATIAHWRARHAAWNTAVDHIEVERFHDAVSARFDSNGTLTAVDIEPSALSNYTNTELEEIITDVLQRTRESVHEQVMDLFAQYLAPNDPRFDPGALGGAYVQLPT